MSALVPSQHPDLLHSPALGDLLRDRIAAALANLAPGTQHAYADALDRFARWFTSWLPAAPATIKSTLAPTTIAAKDWWSIVVRLLRSPPLVASTIVETFRSSPAAGSAPATIALRLAAVRHPFRLAFEAGLVPWQLRVRAPKVATYRDTRGPGLDAVRNLFNAATRVRDPLVSGRDIVLLHGLFTLALRRAEAGELDVQHFDPSGRLFVRGKGKLDRTPISIPADVTTAIANYIALRAPVAVDAPLIASHDRNRTKATAA